MGIKFRHLFGKSAFVRFSILAFILVIGAHRTFGDFGIIIYGPPPPPPPPGYLKVIIDAPANINSAVQWNIGGGWYNNGDTAAVASGGYTLSFRSIAGWVAPVSQHVSVPANSTNTFSGSYRFASLSGDYQGLFSEDSGPKYESCGFCEITGTKGQAFTGKISCGGNKYSISGNFDSSGSAWSTITRRDASSISLHLVAGEDILTGEISNETWTATILAKRNTFDSKTNPAQRAGKYTFAFVGGTNSADQPGGDSFGTMTVDRSGGITLTTTFSDGTKASQKSMLSKDGQWPFYVSLYSGKGFAMGWLQLQGGSELNPPKVKIYRECAFAGEPAALSAGNYNFWDLYYLGLCYSTNFSGQSMKVPNGWTVTLYTGYSYSGTIFTRTEDDSCFYEDGLKYIQSIRVETNGVVPLADFGNVIWAKPVQPKITLYSAGFTNRMQAFVSPYQPTIHGSELNSDAGKIVLQNPSLCFTNEISVDSSGNISGTAKLNLTVATSSGSFKGKLMNPLTRKAISFSGVVLQKQNFGRGFFLDGDQSGNVYFGP